MYFLFSGEGATDLGKGTDPKKICEGKDYEYGPMAVIVDQIVEEHIHHSLLNNHRCGFVPKTMLSNEAKKLGRESPSLTGKRRDRDTGYFYSAARGLASLAKKAMNKSNEDVIAVLFRDSDERKTWKDKRQSMVGGFER